MDMPSKPAVSHDPPPPVQVVARPTRLLDLPEELIRRIFGIVFDGLLEECELAQYECDPFPSRLLFRYRRPSPRQVPRQQIQVSSGLYNSLKQIWDGYLALQASEARAFDEPFSALGNNVRFLDLAEHEPCDSFRMSGQHDLDLDDFRSRRKPPSFDFLIAFSRLTTLRATFFGGIPRTFTDALRYLPHLSDLTLQFHGGMGDACFTFGESTLALRHLALTAEATEDEDLRQLLTNLPSTLEELRFYYTFPAGLPIPWYSVPRLHLYSPRGYFRDPGFVIQDLEAVFSPEVSQTCFSALMSEVDQTHHALGQNPRQVVVQELTIQVLSISLSKCKTPGSVYYEEVIPTMLELMQLGSPIKHLRFLDFTELRWWQNNIRIVSIECVTLLERPPDPDYPQSSDGGNLASLVPFLSMFPSLQKLVFSGFELLTNESVAEAPIPPGSFTTFVQHEPGLSRLLYNLQISRVVEVTYRTSAKSLRELRIRRDRPAAPWEGEWWNV
ncbi:hypothetical protein JCM10049v2_003438 [Rhodotorula toruloides]